MKTSKALLFLGLIIAFSSCSKKTELDLQSGDLVFVGNSASPLSSAIDKVTKTANNTSFSHMGIITIEEGKTFVIHSNSYNGVCKEPLDSFRKNNGTATDSLHIYRLNGNSKKTIEKALHKAHQEIGQTYNSTYIMEDNGFYCSELIYHIFKSDSVFKLSPMTFIDPDTGEFEEIWTDYYRKLGVEIPEGKPGCNPNGMAQNKRLVFIGAI